MLEIIPSFNSNQDAVDWLTINKSLIDGEINQLKQKYILLSISNLLKNVSNDEKKKILLNLANV